MNDNILITHPDCLNHFMERHPERPERLTAVLSKLESGGVTGDMRQMSAKEISLEQLALAHPQSYITSIEKSEPSESFVKVDPDTYMSPGSLRAAKLAAGAVAEATESILSGDAKRAFCAVRPPGHHAEIAESFGFCLFNNIAVSALIALQDDSINRVAILDFDVHHCNGTVDIFKDDPRVLVCSSFQENFFPNRFLDYSNDHIVSTPLTEGMKGFEYRKKIEADWLLKIQNHKPDIIFISAGFDAHEMDHLGNICLLEDDYRWITQFIVDLAETYAQGRIVSVLEGGYNLESLSNSALVHVENLIS
ncbi:MAG: acetoin utilization deacetylase AcuC-like enzyme [Candidatus Azotimanducaceae bacterium]